MICKVSLAFARMSDSELDNFAHGVFNAMTGNAAFASPPVTLANLQTATNDFTAKVAASDAGGPAATAAKNNSRQTLLGILRQLAAYVQMACNNDQATLLTSGFEMQSTTRTSGPLDQPQSLTLKNGSAGQLLAAVQPVRNANMYEGRAKQESGEWLPSVYTGDSQHIVFNGLLRGKEYTVQVRALGGTTGQSDWSDPSTHMAM
jgi:hypothetical protein